MQNKCTNIYKLARNNAGLTQEKAIEFLSVSIKSLQNYERGITIPGDDIVCRMTEVYKSPWLGYQHLKQFSEVGKKYLPDVNMTDLPKSVLRLQKEVGDFKDINNDMIEIACDGEVEGHDKERWQCVTKEIIEMAGAALAVLFAY